MAVEAGRERVPRCNRCAGELVDSKCELCSAMVVLGNLVEVLCPYPGIRRRFTAETSAARKMLARYNRLYPKVEP